MSNGVEVKAAEEREPSTAQLAPDQAPNGKYHLVWRAAALMALVMTAYIWWAHNFGEGLTGVPVIATFAAAFSFAMGLLDESQKTDAKKWFARRLLSLVVLVPASVLIAVLLCCWAPVIVLNQQNEPFQAALSPAESTKSNPDVLVAEKDRPARFHIWTTPLSRAFIIKVPGYAPKAIEVSAPMGLTVSPERDLTPQISLLLRPTADGMLELLSGGTLHVYREEHGKKTEIATKKARTRSSFLIGAAPVALPHDLMEDWRLELAGQQMSDISRANQLLAWKSPTFVKLLSPSDELTAHQMLRVVVRTTGGNDLDCGAIELPEGSGAIADLALRPCGSNQP